MTPYEAKYTRRVEALGEPTCAECDTPLSPATILDRCAQCLIADALEGLRR